MPENPYQPPKEVNEPTARTPGTSVVRGSLIAAAVGAIASLLIGLIIQALVPGIRVDASDAAFGGLVGVCLYLLVRWIRRTRT